MTNYYNQSVKETLASLKVDKDRGLSNREVLKRRKKFGENVLNVKTTSLLKKILEPFLDLFMLMLIFALVLSILQGSWTEVIVFTSSAFRPSAS